jgi:hypothetical protein
VLEEQKDSTAVNVCERFVDNGSLPEIIKD